MRAAVVVQRFGTDIIGGAERHALDYVRRFKSDLGWQVEVFTTCAKDYKTWSNSYNAGSELADFGIVRRFPVVFPRNPLLFGIYSRIFNPIILWLARKKGGSWLGLLFEKIWFTLQGPYCPALVEALKTDRNKFEVIIFFTYLYYPTLKGLPLLREKSILIPTAHDEPPFYFQHIKKVFADARAILYSSKVEKDLIRRVHPGTTQNMFQAGVGVESVTTTAQREDYLLYLGRVSKGKGCDRLLSLFTDYLEGPSARPIRLVLAGQIEQDIAMPVRPGISYLGPVSEEKKAELIAGSLGVVNSSPMESLSIVVLEALTARRPLLLNRDCELFAYYATILSTISLYNDDQSFAAGIEKLFSWREKKTANDFFDLGVDWVDHNYSWSAVLTSVSNAVKALGSPPLT
jgi:glycosyltransferase involved in cell wall biosynthesis